jgi:hypothetical protein
MRHPERLNTPVAEIVVMTDKMLDVVEYEESDARRTNAHTAKWTVIPPKHAAQ